MRSGSQAGTREAKKVKRVNSPTPFGTQFWDFFVIVWSVIFHVFSGVPFWGTLSPFSAQRCLNGRF